jgi:hypothetical protein
LIKNSDRTMANREVGQAEAVQLRETTLFFLLSEWTPCPKDRLEDIINSPNGALLANLISAECNSSLPSYSNKEQNNALTGGH